ncbi:MAG TPA: CoA-binding protein [Clostridia bacterium]|nr:CoA-binding protein [Clostridia bacterium]
MAATSSKDAPARATSTQITEFLNQRRFAAVGLSRDPKDFTRTLVREFETRGYEAVPVNPAVRELGGHECFARVQEIRPAVKAALVLTSPAATEQVVADCIAAGVTHIWMYRGGGVGAVHPAAVALCSERGISVIAGECPLMFLPNTAFPHIVHGLIRKIVGTYPR